MTSDYQYIFCTCRHRDSTDFNTLLMFSVFRCQTITYYLCYPSFIQKLNINKQSVCTTISLVVHKGRFSRVIFLVMEGVIKPNGCQRYLTKDPFKAYLRPGIYIEYTEGIALRSPSLLRMYLASFTHRFGSFSRVYISLCSV